MEFIIQTDSITAPILADIIAQSPTDGIQYKVIPHPDEAPLDEPTQPSMFNGRERLPFLDLSQFIIAISIPASYILMKILDSVLAEFGKSIAQFLKKTWEKRKKSKKTESALYLILIIENANYVLILDQDKILMADQILPSALGSATNHWKDRHTVKPKEEKTIYSLVLHGKGFLIKPFDPFT